MIDALARHGDGLPANVLPVQVNEVTQVGLEAVAGCLCLWRYGRALSAARQAAPRRRAACTRRSRWREPILAGLGFAGARVAAIETDDPDALGRSLARACAAMERRCQAGELSPQSASKRDVMRLALRELHARAPAPVDVVALPQGAPFGTVEVNVEGCTLCLSCVSACPTGALSDDPERPMLRFAEDACVQCGLCKATCPEKVISLKPQIDFRAATASSRVHQAGRAVPLHPLRQAVRREELGRARRRQARRQALDVQGLQEAPRRRQDVRRLPRAGDGGRELRSVRRAPAPAPCAPPTIICASAKSDGEELTLLAGHPRRENPPAPCGPRASRCSAPASWCRAYRHRADLEQFRNRLRRPDDVELLQRGREIIARQVAMRRPKMPARSGRPCCLRRA